MAITVLGDQHILDGLDILKPILNLQYKISAKLARWRLWIRGKSATLIEDKPITLAGQKSVAIFVMIENRPDIRDYIEDIKAAGYYIIVVVNKLTVKLDNEIAVIADAVVYRENLGRDFGAYADIANLLYKRGSQDINRVLFANDSMYYLKKGSNLLKILFEDNSDYSAITATEIPNIYFCHAYLYQMSGKIFNHRRVKRYFCRYIPIDSARYAVTRGEMGLSRLITNRLSVSPKIYYRHSSLSLSDRTVATDLDRQMEWLGLPNTESIITDTTSMSLWNKEKSKISGDAVPLLWSLRDGSMIEESHTIAFIEKILYLDPSQQLGLLFFKHTDFPFVKRNILVKGYVSFDGLRQVIECLPHGPITLQAMLRNYGSYYAQTKRSRILSFASLWGYR